MNQKRSDMSWGEVFPALDSAGPFPDVLSEVQLTEHKVLLLCV